MQQCIVWVSAKTIFKLGVQLQVWATMENLLKEVHELGEGKAIPPALSHYFGCTLEEEHAAAGSFLWDKSYGTLPDVDELKHNIHGINARLCGGS